MLKCLECERFVNSRMSFWGTDSTDHSDKFLRDLLQLNQCFVAMLRDINEDHGTTYDVEALEEMAETLEATAELEGTGFLPSSFYYYSRIRPADGGEYPEDTWEQIHAKKDDYFAKTFRSFFNEKSQPIIDAYMDLFTRKTADGELMLDDDDREVLWEWIHSLAGTAVKHELCLTNSSDQEKYPTLLKYKSMFCKD